MIDLAVELITVRNSQISQMLEMPNAPVEVRAPVENQLLQVWEITRVDDAIVV